MSSAGPIRKFERRAIGAPAGSPSFARLVRRRDSAGIPCRVRLVSRPAAVDPARRNWRGGDEERTFSQRNRRHCGFDNFPNRCPLPLLVRGHFHRATPATGSSIETQDPIRTFVDRPSKSSLEPRRHPVEERAKLQRHGLSLRIDNMDGHRFQLEFFQDDGERARASCSFHLVRHDARYARSGNRRLDSRLRGVDSQSRPYGRGNLFLAFYESPRALGAKVIDCYALMMYEILEVFWVSTRLEIFRAGASHQSNRSDTSRNHTAVRK